MNTQKTLFTQVDAFYNNLLSELGTAQDLVSMMYYAFDHGEWAQKIAHVLADKAQSGVRVRLMADKVGQLLDEPRHAFKNQTFLRDLQTAGIRVEVFDPTGNRLTKLNRLHCKVCAIDNRTAFLGGSNIGDHYPTWDDSNLRLDGPLGDTFHQVYEYICSFSNGQNRSLRPDLNLSTLQAGDAQVWLTVPKQRCDIRREFLNLILNANESIYLRTWCFLPDREILNALRSQAEKGVEVNVLLSHKTRVRPIDFANFLHCHKLAKSGGRIYRYTEKYMHAKVAWNNHGDVLFGSANLSNVALQNTFECCVSFRDRQICQNLHQAFEADAQLGFIQTPEIFPRRSIHHKALSYVCNLASPWL